MGKKQNKRRTGFISEKGEDIFIGDVLVASGDSEPKTRFYVTDRYGPENIAEKKTLSGIEVIGNIFDNPELWR